MRRDRKEARVLTSRDRDAGRLSAGAARAIVPVNLRGATVWSA
jgi:hypothetical protein